MKIKMLMITSGLFFFASTLWADEENWSATSREKQFDQQSDYFEKSSTSVKSGKDIDGQTTQSKNVLLPQSESDLSHTKSIQEQAARSLSVRPQVQKLEHEFWIYDATVTLHSDADYDGYYPHFSVEFDADTIFEHADVYARLYLGTGDTFHEYHSTAIFHLDGESELDSLVVESELLSGFPTNEYEVLIELYDAYSDELVAIYDGNDDADLYSLSLESEDYEVVYVEPQIVFVTEGAGSFAYLTLLLLPFFIFRKIRGGIKSIVD